MLNNIFCKIKNKFFKTRIDQKVVAIIYFFFTKLIDIIYENTDNRIKFSLIN